MFERLFQVIKAAFNNLLGKVEDPAIVLERTYMSLQSQIIQLRRAVAQAVATEEQLERALAKNKDHSPADLRSSGQTAKETHGGAASAPDRAARRAVEGVYKKASAHRPRQGVPGHDQS